MGVEGAVVVRSVDGFVSLVRGDGLFLLGRSVDSLVCSCSFVRWLFARLLVSRCLGVILL